MIGNSRFRILCNRIYIIELFQIIAQWHGDCQPLGRGFRSRPLTVGHQGIGGNHNLGAPLNSSKPVAARSGFRGQARKVWEAGAVTGAFWKDAFNHLRNEIGPFTGESGCRARCASPRPYRVLAIRGWPRRPVSRDPRLGASWGTSIIRGIFRGGEKQKQLRSGNKKCFFNKRRRENG